MTVILKNIAQDILLLFIKNHFHKAANIHL